MLSALGSFQEIAEVWQDFDEEVVLAEEFEAIIKASWPGALLTVTAVAVPTEREDAPAAFRPCRRAGTEGAVRPPRSRKCERSPPRTAW